jgi:hypothetical protein
MSLSIFTGWLPGASVRQLVKEKRDIFRALPFVLVSYVDSDPHVATQTWARKELEHDADWAISRSPLVIAGHHFVDAVEGPLKLAGFDEIWIPSRLPIPTPPEGAHIMAPRQLKRGASVKRSIATWMRRSDCRLGLGDGFGLNFVATDVGLVSQLGLSELAD